MQRSDRRRFYLMVALSLGLGGAASGYAQTRPAAPAARPAVDRNRPPANPTSPPTANASGGLFDIIFSVGLTGLLILLVLLLLSVTAVALAIEHLMTIRQKVFMPPGLADDVHTELAAGKLAAALQVCSGHPSFLAFVLHAGLTEAEGGWTAVEKAMEDATAEQAARLFRKIEYLSVIGNIAPMVGLLGTVTGMIFAFQQVADTQGAARAGQLAEGIYTALITTVGGLLVAIPALAAFAVFRNRVDQLVAEVAHAALHVTVPLKRGLARRAAAVATPRPAAPRPTTPGGA